MAQIRRSRIQRTMPCQSHTKVGRTPLTLYAANLFAFTLARYLFACAAPCHGCAVGLSALRTSQRQTVVCFHFFQRQVGVNGVYARDGAQPLYKLAVVVQVAGHHQQHVVGVTGNFVACQHLGVVAHQSFECGGLRVAYAGKAQADVGKHVQA